MADRMLIIDDEKIVLDSCRKIFSDEGFGIVTTDSPREGLKLFSESVFDVILCDWKMPGLDRMDVVEEIDWRSPESAVVMISGFPTMGRATEALKRGAMDYLPKPFTPEEIVEVVRKASKRKVSEEKKPWGASRKLLRLGGFPCQTLRIGLRRRSRRRWRRPWGSKKPLLLFPAFSFWAFWPGPTSVLESCSPQS